MLVLVVCLFLVFLGVFMGLNSELRVKKGYGKEVLMVWIMIVRVIES